MRSRILNTLNAYQTERRLSFDAVARRLWCNTEYTRLTADRLRLYGAITSRAEAQVVRLSLLYALLDQQSEIGITHLKAALAVWDYCDQSARYIFGDKTGDAIADVILTTLRTTLRSAPEGRTKTELWHALPSHNIAVNRIDNAMQKLVTQGLIKTQDGHPAGRRNTIWVVANNSQNS
jgi:hypothetical protein